MDIVLAKDAQKHYKKFSKVDQAKIKKKLISLSKDPYGGKKLEGELKRRRSLRAWPYRIIYSLNEKENRIEVSDILHRQGAYK